MDVADPAKVIFETQIEALTVNKFQSSPFKDLFFPTYKIIIRLRNQTLTELAPLCRIAVAIFIETELTQRQLSQPFWDESKSDQLSLSV